MVKSFFSALMFLLPLILFFSQCFVAAILGWKLFRKKKQEGSFKKAIGVLLSIVLIATPILWLVFSTILFPSGYRGEKGSYWFYYLNEGWAGAATIPLYLIASWVVGVSIFKVDYRKSSKSLYLALMTLIVIAGWYTFATLKLELTNTEIGNSEFLAVFPAVSGLNYFLYLCFMGVSKHENDSPFVFRVWMSGIVATVFAKVLLAFKVRELLPAEIPLGYGDCFIVSAAARGHSWFVGSRSVIGQQGIVNNQLIHFRDFERFLALRFPLFHKTLRRYYNRVGPLLAQRIRHAYQADIVYLLLKPIELLTKIILRLSKHG